MYINLQLHIILINWSWSPDIVEVLREWTLWVKAGTRNILC